MKQLDMMGYFDFDSDWMALENEFLQNRNIGKAHLTGSVPLAGKIIKMKNDSKPPSKSTLEDSFLDCIMEVDPDQSYDDLIDLKRELIIMGERYINNKKYGDARELYKRLLSHELFANDYYPYKRLSFIYRKDGQFEEDEMILTEFFKSGIYCDDKQLAWFKNRFKLLGRMEVFDSSKMYDLENEFYSKGARNQALSDTSVPIANKINLNYHATKKILS